MAGDRLYLIDVSRLVWRLWKGRLPTGIDRVCLAYVENFGSRAQAVVQSNGIRRILSPSLSDRLFELILQGEGEFKRQVVQIIARSMLELRPPSLRDNRIYLNVGHTGLDAPNLPGWIESSGLKAIFMIHDLIPITHPEFCREGENEKHRLRLDNVLACAAGIIGNSRTTLTQMAEYGAATDQALPPTLPAWIAGHAKPPEPILPAPSDKPYFVSVGTIEGRKNHILLLNIWQRMIAVRGDQTPLLVIIGQRGWEAETTLAMLDRTPSLKGHVLELNSCSDAQLASYLKGARALLMPSFAEGFGIPVIEALQLGTPVIASDLAVFRELVADIPEYLDSFDGAGWFRTIGDYLEDGPARFAQLARMQGYREPNWAGHFERVEKWLSDMGLDN